jgi:AmmeMemoRadiSam system protein B
MRRPDVHVLPMTVGHLTFEECRELGSTLARTVAEVGEPVGLVASSDMSHYEPDAVARDLDRLAIDAALDLDPEALYRTVHDRRISMCGVVPTTIVMVAALAMGATEAHQVAYSTSGDVSGDRTSVVGYAGLCFHSEV